MRCLAYGSGNTAMETGTSHERWAPMFLSILRIVAALIFIEHGTQKFFGFPAEPANGYPAFLSLIWWQALIEVAGGILLLLGLFTRLTAFILAGDMAVAYWMVPCAQERLSRAEWRRCGDPLLLRVPLHRSGGGRGLEPRQSLA